MEQFERFWNYSLKYLSYRPRSVQETVNALHRKKAPEDVVRKIIEKLIELKLLDDEKFAVWWVDQRNSFKPKGERVIKMELIEKGISKEIIEQVLSALSSTDTQKATAVELLKKRIYKYKGMTMRETKEKMLDFLVRRGFDFDLSKSAIDEVLGK